MAKLTYNELKYALEYNADSESLVGIPNDIFKTLTSDEVLVKKNHVGLAYGYIYLSAWLWKYAKYNLPLNLISIEGMNEILGHNRNDRRLNYIMKSKTNVLEKLGLTKLVKFNEAPVESLFEKGFNKYGDTWDYVGYKSYQEWIDEQHPEDVKQNIEMGIYPNVSREKVLYPVFGLDNRIVDDEEIEGTFFDMTYTHAVPFDVFVKCMTTDDLGTTAFYIYAYLYSRCGMNGYHQGESFVEVSIDKMTSATGIKTRTLNKYLGNLKAYGLVNCDPADYIIGKGDIETGASVYQCVTDENAWHNSPQKYAVREVISAEEYDKKKKILDELENEDLFGKK